MTGWSLKFDDEHWLRKGRCEITRVNYEANAATVADPLVIAFRLDVSLVSDGLIGVAQAFTVFKDGVALPDCDDPGTGEAVPDPSWCSAPRAARGTSGRRPWCSPGCPEAAWCS
jgi:hypothetical protein